MAKLPDRLVVKHLENIPRKVLVKYPEISKRYLSGNQGIYALYMKDQLRYVGIAPNLIIRLNAHHKNQAMPKWDRFSVYFTELREFNNELEALINRIADLNLSRKRKGFKKSENLRSLFRKDVFQTRDLDQYGNIPLSKIQKEIKIPVTRQTAGTKTKAPQKTPKRKNDRQKPKKRSTIMPYINRKMFIYARYKNQTYKALIRVTGLIYFKGGLYTSPSAAAKAITGTNVDGWRFWKFKNAQGKWVPLKELRKK